METFLQFKYQVIQMKIKIDIKRVIRVSVANKNSLFRNIRHKFLSLDKHN